jgi:hypothetical protein
MDPEITNRYGEPWYTQRGWRFIVVAVAAKQLMAYLLPRL